MVFFFYACMWFCSYSYGGTSSVQCTLNGCDQVNPTGLFGYEVQQNNLFHLKKCNIVPSFDFDNSTSSFAKNFPAKEVNVIHSVIVANGKSRLVGSFIWTHFVTRTNFMKQHGLILLPELIRLIIVSSVLTFQETISN